MPIEQGEEEKTEIVLWIRYHWNSTPSEGLHWTTTLLVHHLAGFWLLNNSSNTKIEITAPQQHCDGSSLLLLNQRGALLQAGKPTLGKRGQENLNYLGMCDGLLTCPLACSHSAAFRWLQTILKSSKQWSPSKTTWFWTCVAPCTELSFEMHRLTLPNGTVVHQVPLCIRMLTTYLIILRSAAHLCQHTF